MIARFGVLFALFLGCAPIASAQHVIPPVQLAYPSLNGTWNMGAPFLGTLTLTVTPNGALRGAYLSPLLGDYADCRGEFRGAGYFLTCQEAGKDTVLFSGAAEPMSFTVQGSPSARMRGYMYIVSISANLSTTPLNNIPYRATR